MDQQLNYQNATKQTIKNTIIIQNGGNLIKYQNPDNFNNNQSELLYHAIAVFHFLSFNHNITFNGLAELIKKSYDLNTPQNNECYKILLMADQNTR